MVIGILGSVIGILGSVIGILGSVIGILGSVIGIIGSVIGIPTVLGKTRPPSRRRTFISNVNNFFWK